MTRLLAALLLAATAGCFRLTDPVYAFKSLKAPEPDDAGESLVFGTLELEGFLVGNVDTLVVRRMSPYAGTFHVLTEQSLFRAFQRRPMKDGNFVLSLPPGAYEIVEVSTSSLLNPKVIAFGDSARYASRFTVTRPGIYDLGVLHMKPKGTFSMTYEGTSHPGDAAHGQVLRDAVAGTRWQRFLEGS